MPHLSPQRIMILWKLILIFYAVTATDEAQPSTAVSDNETEQPTQIINVKIQEVVTATDEVQTSTAVSDNETSQPTQIINVKIQDGNDSASLAIPTENKKQQQSERKGPLSDPQENVKASVPAPETPSPAPSHENKLVAGSHRKTESQSQIDATKPKEPYSQTSQSNVNATEPLGPTTETPQPASLSNTSNSSLAPKAGKNNPISSGILFGNKVEVNVTEPLGEPATETPQPAPEDSGNGSVLSPVTSSPGNLPELRLSRIETEPPSQNDETTLEEPTSETRQIDVILTDPIGVEPGPILPADTDDQQQPDHQEPLAQNQMNESITFSTNESSDNSAEFLPEENNESTVNSNQGVTLASSHNINAVSSDHSNVDVNSQQTAERSGHQNEGLRLSSALETEGNSGVNGSSSFLTSDLDGIQKKDETPADPIPTYHDNPISNNTNHVPNLNNGTSNTKSTGENPTVIALCVIGALTVVGTVAALIHRRNRQKSPISITPEILDQFGTVKSEDELSVKSTDSMPHINTKSPFIRNSQHHIYFSSIA